jgi:hypothetical protein
VSLVWTEPVAGARYEVVLTAQSPGHYPEFLEFLHSALGPEATPCFEGGSGAG